MRKSPTFAERFWAQGRGPDVEELPEPERSLAIVRQFLAVLDRFDEHRQGATQLITVLRQAELEGDLSYASPEQVRGEEMDERSVVFSVGVVLFERLTGKHPCGAENNHVRRIERIRRGEMGSGVNHFPTVAAGLRSVLVRAMGPFPEERWVNLDQMRQRLSQFVTDEAPAPHLPGTGESTRVVRSATDFGRDLMAAAARHDRPVRPVLAVSPPSEVPAAPAADSVSDARDHSAMVTIERRFVAGVDPLGPTVEVEMAEMAARRGGRQAPSDEESVVIEMGPLRPVTPEPLPAAAIARAKARATDAPPVAVSSPSAISPPAAAPVESPPPGMSPALHDLAVMAANAAIPPEPEPRPRPNAVIGLLGVIVGAAIATVAFLIGRGGAEPKLAASVSMSENRTPATAALTAPAARAAEAPAAAPAHATVSAPAAAPALAAVPAPAAPSAKPAAPAPAIAPASAATAPLIGWEAVTAAVTPCFAGRGDSQVFGLSLAVKPDGVVQKSYFGGNLPAADRQCVADRVRGMTYGRAGLIELAVRVGPTGVHVGWLAH